jgi:phosphatidylglycerol:prolipoprotein diacylglycerol transferase
MGTGLVAYLSWRVDTQRHFLGIPFFPHGVLIAVGFVVGGLIFVRYSRRADVAATMAWDIVTAVALGSLVGTRLVWVVGNWSQVGSVGEALKVWHGGMTLYGGILGGVVAGVVAARRRRLPVPRLLDYAAPALAIGIALGRASDLIIGDHLGKATGMPWGFRYLGTNPPGEAPALGAVVHPVALYDLLLVSALFVVLVAFLRSPRAAGSAALVFAAWYSAERLILDFFRTDPIRALGLTGTQLASIAVLLAVGGLLSLRGRRLHRPHVAHPMASARLRTPGTRRSDRRRALVLATAADGRVSTTSPKGRRRWR